MTVRRIPSRMPRDLLLPDPIWLRLGEDVLSSEKASPSCKSRLSFMDRSPLRFHWLNTAYIIFFIYITKNWERKYFSAKNPNAALAWSDIKDWRTARRWVKSQCLEWQDLIKRSPRAFLVLFSWNLDFALLFLSTKSSNGNHLYWLTFQNQISRFYKPIH